MNAENKRHLILGTMGILSLALVLLLSTTPSIASPNKDVGFQADMATAEWVTGPTTGMLGLTYTFTATVEASSVVLPVTDYMWKATDYTDSVMHSSDKLSDTVTFNWSTPGPKTITVTVYHGGAKLVGTHTISIEKSGHYEVYLPFIANTKAPPYKPVIASIDNGDNDGNYTVTWTEQPTRLATMYVLQESTTEDFPTGTTEDHPTGNQNWTATDKAEGTYYYRVRGWNSAAGYGPWSDTQSVTVLPPGPDIRITYIEYHPHTGNPKDEYVKIENFGRDSQLMTNWKLVSDSTGKTYVFSNFTLGAGSFVRVWSRSSLEDTETDLYWPTLNWTQNWNDAEDTAYLYDASGTLVFEYSYP